MTTTPPPGAIFVTWIIVLVAVGFVMMLLFKLAVWWGSRVNGCADDTFNDMSSSEDSAPVLPLSSKDGQSSGRTDSLVYERAELLTLYKLLRSHGVTREEARPVLKAMRIPLSNDVWADSAPPPPKATAEPDDELVTPFAGRRTRASYYPEQPELEYQAPA